MDDKLTETMITNGTSDLDNCAFSYEPQQFLSIKIVMVSLCGTTIAVASMLENFLLIYMFCTRPQLRASHLYFAVLSVFDIFMSLSYIFLMSMATYADWASNLFMYQLWHSYLRPSFTFSHVAMTASTYLIIAATVERYCTSSVHFRYLRLKMRANQQTVIVIAIGLALLFKGTIYFEIGVLVDRNCTDPFASLRAVLTPMAQHPIYNVVWRFWIRNILTIFLPFILLAYCNAAIVLKLKEQTKKQTVKALALSPFLARCQIQDTKSMRRDVRSATRMMIMVVSCYLIANLLSVVLTAWEHIDAVTLLTEYGTFFTLGSDAASLLTVVAGALRLPIYAVNNPQIRHELAVILKRLIRLRTKRHNRRSRRDLEVSKDCETESTHEPFEGCRVATHREVDSWLSAADDSVTEKRFCETKQGRSSLSHSSSDFNCTSVTRMNSSGSERDPNLNSRGIVTAFVLHQNDDNMNGTNSSIDYVTWKPTVNQ